MSNRTARIISRLHDPKHFESRIPDLLRICPKGSTKSKAIAEFSAVHLAHLR